MDNSFNLIIDLCSFLPSVSYKNYKNIKINLKIISKILNAEKKGHFHVKITVGFVNGTIVC